jgi:hypothetical protein
MLLPLVRAREPRSYAGVQMELCDRAHPDATPDYLVLADRRTAVTADGDTSAVAAALSAALSGGALMREAPDVFALVGVLAQWDALFSELELWHQNIYTASESSVERLLRLAGIGDDICAQVGRTLDDLQALELLYRFPVALKFSGDYAAANQCRLNGWGRRLATQLIADDEQRAHLERWKAALKKTIMNHHGDYRAHLEALRSPTRDSWLVAQTLPVPVLI